MGLDVTWLLPLTKITLGAIFLAQLAVWTIPFRALITQAWLTIFACRFLFRTPEASSHMASSEQNTHGSSLARPFLMNTLAGGLFYNSCISARPDVKMLNKRLILSALLSALLANAAPATVELSKRQSIIPLSSAQITAFKPFTYFASAAHCSSNTTINWSCGGMALGDQTKFCWTHITCS